MENKSTITKVTGNGTWMSPNGLMYKWEVEMANGDTGNCMTKSPQPDKWMVGKDVAYTKEVKGNYTNFKLVQEKQDSFKPRQVNEKSIIAQVALKCAAQVLQQSQTGQDPKKVIEMADVFNDWLIKKSGL